MKIAICDDEQVYIDDIKKHLDCFSAENGIEFEKSIFTDAKSVLSSDLCFDIAILDVEMGEINGIRLGEELRKKNPHIILIYVTAHKKYLDDALNLNAVRFFEKPLDPQRFYRGLSDAIKRIDNSSINFYLKNESVMQRVSAQDIIFVEIEKRKTKVVTRTNVYHCEHHINFWHNKLTSSIFTSPHKSYIINFNYVTEYERNHIILDNRFEVPVARNKQADFYRKFMRFVEGK